MFTVWLYFSMSSVRKKERGKKKKKEEKEKVSPMQITLGMY